MSFEDKKIKAFMFRTGNEWSNEIRALAVENIRDHRAAKLDEVDEEVNIGWASGKSELDTEIYESNCMVGDHIHLSMRIAVRKVPTGIARAMYRKKAAEYMAVNSVDYVSAKMKKQMKEEVHEYLLPRSMPTIKSVWVIIRPDGTVYAGTASRTERDQLCELFFKTFRVDLVPCDFHSCKEGEDVPDTICESPDLEFLTDLFRQSDSGEAHDFIVEPPFDLISANGEGMCTRAMAVGECASSSREVRAALDEKKLLCKTKLCVTGESIPGYQPGDAWKFVLNRDGSLVGLSTPEGEEMNFAGRFVERIDMLSAIFVWILEKFRDFMKRAALPEYAETREAWLRER